ncbi:MAG: transglutaminase-like domain-containing protein [Bacteroidales bacterium]|nr:transglutaminase-like domain-containing protein [Bacteroidales bacterium]
MRTATYDIEKVLKAIPEASGKTVIIGTGGLDLTIETILKTVKQNIDALKEFAEAIQGNTLEQTAYNIWHFIKTNIKYVKDKPLTEEIRTPQRTLADKIGDCDDYSVFAATILKALAYEPFFYIVAFNGAENYGHIYVGVDNLIIDGVMPDYGKHPDGITKTMLLKLNGKRKIIYRNPQTINNTAMLVEQLAGMPKNDISELINSEHARLTDLTGQLTEEEKEDLNKIRVLKLLSGNPYRDYMLEIMPDIAGIDNDFNISFHNEDDMNEAEELLDKYNELQGLGDINGFGKLFSKWRKNKDKRKDRRKKFFSKVKKISKKVTKFTKKYALAPARGAILLLLKLNMFKWGSRLWISYLPESKARSYGFDMNAFHKLVAFRKKFENFFEKSGGKKIAIWNAVNSRGAKIARKKYGINGLGIVVATTAGASAAVASPFLAWLAKAWSSVKGPFNKMFAKVKDSKVLKTVVDKFKDAKKEEPMPDTVIDPDNYASANTKNKETTDKKSNMLLPLAAAGLLLMFIL